eukprot:gene16726-18420_t
MLAEPKYKQKWAQDPRNTQWSKDKSKFGYQLMSKMGWSEGKGLGANEDGEVSHVKVKNRRENLGLGSTTNHSENWLAHQDDFNSLLANLNQKNSKQDDASLKNEETERTSLKSNVQKSRKKIFYSKFIHSKDLSMKSKNDLNCVMGHRSKSTPATPQELSEDESANSDASTASCPVGDVSKSQGIVTTNSEMNLQEYFAQKMAAMKKRVRATNDDDCDDGNQLGSVGGNNCTESNDEASDSGLQLKKRKKNTEEDLQFDDEEVKEKKTKKKKSKKSKKNEELVMNEDVKDTNKVVDEVAREEKKAKKMKNDKKSLTKQNEFECEEEKLKDKKKKKKRKYNEVNEDVTDVSLNSVSNVVKKRKKSKSSKV